MTTKPTRLDEIRARLAAATPGPWRYDGMHNEITTPRGNDGYWLIVSECRSAPDEVLRQEAERNCFDANFDLIAHMREDMALLLAVADAVIAFADATTVAEAAAWFRGEELQNADSYVAGDKAMSQALEKLT